MKTKRSRVDALFESVADSLPEKIASDSFSDEDNESIGDHKEQLRSLKEQDPEFYAFLEENEKELLDFDGEDEDDAADDDHDDDDGGGGLVEEVEEVEMDMVMLDDERIDDMETALASNAGLMSVAKEVVKVFRVGCSMSVPGDDDIELDVASDGSFGVKGSPYRFADQKCYQRVMTQSVLKVMDAVDRYMGRNREDLKWSPVENPRWKKVEIMMKSLVKNMVLLVEGIKDEPTKRILMKRCERMIPYLPGLEKQGKKMIKAATSAWVASEEDGTVIRAFLLLHQLGRAHEGVHAEEILKAMHRAYSKLSSVCNARILPRIELSCKCLVEIHGIHMSTSYQVSFMKIRELALTLKAALTSKGKSEIDKVYNWEYINQLRLWTRVLSVYNSEEQLRPLIYPFCQITTTIMTMVPSAKNLGVRFHCGVFLNELGTASDTFIPLAGSILEVFEMADVKRGLEGVDSTRNKTLGKSLDWRVLLRVPEASIGTPAFVTSVVERALFILAMHCSSISRSPSFPEIAHALMGPLRKTARLTRMPSLRQEVKLLIESLSQTSDLITSLRRNAEFTPASLSASASLQCKELRFSTAKHTPIEELFNALVIKTKKQDNLRDISTLETSKSAPSGESKDNANAPQTKKKQKRQKTSLLSKSQKSLQTKLNPQELLRQAHDEDQLGEIDDVSKFFD